MADSSEDAHPGRTRDPIAVSWARSRRLRGLRPHRAVEVTIPAWIGPPVPMPEMCAICGAGTPAAYDGRKHAAAAFEPLPVVVHEPVTGWPGAHTAHAELLFPVCRACAQRAQDGRHDIGRAVRVVGARGRHNGVEIVLAVRNRSFARAFAAVLAAQQPSPPCATGHV